MKITTDSFYAVSKPCKYIFHQKRDDGMFVSEYRCLTVGGGDTEHWLLVRYIVTFNESMQCVSIEEHLASVLSYRFEDGFWGKDVNKALQYARQFLTDTNFSTEKVQFFKNEHMKVDDDVIAAAREQILQSSQ